MHKNGGILPWEADHIRLSERDSLRVLDLLGNPPAPKRKAAGCRSGAATTAMPVTAWHEEPIYKKHDREAFDCGEEALNEFLRRYARKSHRAGRRGLARHDVPGFPVGALGPG